MRPGDRLREARERLGLSQKALAARVPFSAAYIGQLELGERTGKPERWHQLAVALGVDAAWLLFGEDASDAARATARNEIVLPVEENVLRHDGLLRSRGAFDALVPVRLDRGPVARPAKQHEAITHPDATDRWFVVMVDQPMPAESGLQLMDRIVFRPDDLELLGEDQLIVYGRDEPDSDTDLEMRLGKFHGHLWHAWALPITKGNPPVPLGGPEGWRVIAKAVELRRNLDVMAQPHVEDHD